MSSASPNLGRFDFSEVDDAPDGPGLYAWYGQIAIGHPDWNPPGCDDYEGANRLLRLLIKHSQRFVGGQIDVGATYSFDAKWFGRLEDRAAEEFTDILSQSGPRKQKKDPFFALKTIVADPASRRILVNLLSTTTPNITAPIYIGKAKSLRNRLLQHTRQILRLHERVLQNPEFRDRLPLKPRFADRAVSLGFSPSLLHVFTWDLTPFVSDAMSRETLVRLARALETLLNRWHRPLLGRK
jgi:hypothetical protein